MLYVSLESLLIMIQIFGSDGRANSINGQQDQFPFSDLPFTLAYSHTAI